MIVRDPTQTGSLVGDIQTLAAVDLGSNSFRMVIARVVGNGLQLVDRLREGVRLAGHLDKHQHLTATGRQRALDCLRKFGQRLRDLPPSSVRAVGTNTLRKAKDRDRFLQDAEHALGHSIEIISGQEEARLIYLGAAHSLAGAESSRRLVIDIGGGSTELVVGDGFIPKRAESLYMGCVAYTLAHFPNGKITAKRLRKAQTAASLELRAHDAEFRRLGWGQAVGASGTVKAIADILRQEGWSGRRGITSEGLDHLRDAMLAAGHVDALDLRSLGRDRAKVLPGGFAILAAAFDRLRIDSMRVSPGALREGVLYDLLGRLRHEDARDRTIHRLVEQYRVDLDQAARVEATALDALDQVAESWNLDRTEGRAYLSWAARLHEIGLAIAHGGFHKHGMYILEHSDMPGFSFPNQRMLALLVRGQRRKLDPALFSNMPTRQARTALRLCVLVRLACLLNRQRSSRPISALRLRAKGKKLRVTFAEGWLDEHPLTRADLEREIKYLASVKIRLRVSTAKRDRDDAAPSIQEVVA